MIDWQASLQDNLRQDHKMMSYLADKAGKHSRCQNARPNAQKTDKPEQMLTLNSVMSAIVTFGLLR